MFFENFKILPVYNTTCQRQGLCVDDRDAENSVEMVPGFLTMSFQTKSVASVYSKREKNVYVNNSCIQYNTKHRQFVQATKTCINIDRIDMRRHPSDR